MLQVHQVSGQQTMAQKQNKVPSLQGNVQYTKGWRWGREWERRGGKGREKEEHI